MTIYVYSFSRFITCRLKDLYFYICKTRTKPLDSCRKNGSKLFEVFKYVWINITDYFLYTMYFIYVFTFIIETLYLTPSFCYIYFTYIYVK